MEELDELPWMDILNLSRFIRAPSGSRTRGECETVVSQWVSPKCVRSCLHRGDSHFYLPTYSCISILIVFSQRIRLGTGVLLLFTGFVMIIANRCPWSITFSATLVDRCVKSVLSIWSLIFGFPFSLIYVYKIYLGISFFPLCLFTFLSFSCCSAYMAQSLEGNHCEINI